MPRVRGRIPWDARQAAQSLEAAPVNLSKKRGRLRRRASAGGRGRSRGALNAQSAGALFGRFFALVVGGSGGFGATRAAPRPARRPRPPWVDPLREFASPGRTGRAAAPRGGARAAPTANSAAARCVVGTLRARASSGALFDAQTRPLARRGLAAPCRVAPPSPSHLSRGRRRRRRPSCAASRARRARRPRRTARSRRRRSRARPRPAAAAARCGAARSRRRRRSAPAGVAAPRRPCAPRRGGAQGKRQTNRQKTGHTKRPHHTRRLQGCKTPPPPAAQLPADGQPDASAGGGSRRRVPRPARYIWCRSDDLAADVCGWHRPSKANRRAGRFGLVPEQGALQSNQGATLGRQSGSQTPEVARKALRSAAARTMWRRMWAGENTFQVARPAD